MKFLASFLIVLVVLVCNVYCQRGVTMPEDCKPGVDTYARSYEDCTLYYECVGAKWVSRRCSNDLYWNHDRKKCGEPETAGCIQA